MNLLILIATLFLSSEQTAWKKQVSFKPQLQAKTTSVTGVHDLMPLLERMSDQVRPYLLASLLTRRDEAFWKEHPRSVSGTNQARIEVSRVGRNGENLLVRLTRKLKNPHVFLSLIPEEQRDGWEEMRKSMEWHGRRAWIGNLWERVLRGHPMTLPIGDPDFERYRKLYEGFTIFDGKTGQEISKPK